MIVSIVPIGEFDLDLSRSIGRGVSGIIPETECKVEEASLGIPENCYNALRRQYHSTMLLHELELKAGSYACEKVLGVTEVDLYVPGMNFVFGEATLWGRCCLISTFRLRPEFYGFPSDQSILLKRCVKEAVHELGHTLGLRHCSVSSCVMHFSLSVSSVDFKGPEFCKDCGVKVKRSIEEV